MTIDRFGAALRKCRTCADIYAEDSAHPCLGGSDPYTAGMTIEEARKRYGIGTAVDPSTEHIALIDAARERDAAIDAFHRCRGERDVARLEARAYGNALAREKNRDERIRRVKAIREETGCGLKEALDIVNGSPTVVAVVGRTLVQDVDRLAEENARLREALARLSGSATGRDWFHPAFVEARRVLASLTPKENADG